MFDLRDLYLLQKYVVEKVNIEKKWQKNLAEK